jgi:hypothetical protein
MEYSRIKYTGVTGKSSKSTGILLMQGLKQTWVRTSKRRMLNFAAFFMALSFTGNLYCAASCEAGAAPVAAVNCPMHAGQPANNPGKDQGHHDHSCPGCSDSKVAPQKASQLQPTEVALPFYEAALPPIKEPAAANIFRHSLDPATSPPLRLFLWLRVLLI